MEVLLESDAEAGCAVGRTRQFAEVTFARAPCPAGGIVAARIVGHDGRRLMGEATP